MYVGIHVVTPSRREPCSTIANIIPMRSGLLKNEKLHFTSLGYLRLDDMLDSVGIDKSKLCTYCWNGKE